MCKAFTGNSQTVKSSIPGLYASASLLSRVLCCKQYISMYLDEYPAKVLTFCEIKCGHKNAPPPKP